MAGYMASAASDEWQTPRNLYDNLHGQFKFSLDPCTSAGNPLGCPYFHTAKTDGLARDWHGHTTFVNPPYSNLKAWVAKCHEQAGRGATIVLLIPARTDTAAWHDHVMSAAEVRLVRGRLTFWGAAAGAPFPSAIVIFRPGLWTPRFVGCDRIGNVHVPVADLWTSAA